MPVLLPGIEMISSSPWSVTLLIEHSPSNYFLLIVSECVFSTKLYFVKEKLIFKNLPISVLSVRNCSRVGRIRRKFLNPNSTEKSSGLIGKPGHSRTRIRIIKCTTEKSVNSRFFWWTQIKVYWRSATVGASCTRNANIFRKWEKKTCNYFEYEKCFFSTETYRISRPIRRTVVLLVRNFRKK